MTCDTCGRKTWAVAVRDGDPCAMPQPSGVLCAGHFTAPATRPAPVSADGPSPSMCDDFGGKVTEPRVMFAPSLVSPDVADLNGPCDPVGDVGRALLAVDRDRLANVERRLDRLKVLHGPRNPHAHFFDEAERAELWSVLAEVRAILGGE